MNTPPRVVFGQGFEGLFCPELRARLTPSLVEQLARLGVNIHKPFNPAYTIETWQQTIELLARELYPTQSMGDAQKDLGRITLRGYGETLVGKALFAMLRIIGPVRAIERAARSYASTNNYTQVTLTRTGPNEYDFGINEKHTLPEYDMGVSEAMLEYLGVKDGRVTLVSKDAEGFTMHLSWK